MITKIKLSIVLLLWSSALPISAQSKWAQDQFFKGEIELHVGEFKEALKYYSQAITYSPRYKEAYYSRAKTHMLMNDSSSAILDFQKLIALDSRDARAYFYIGYMAYQSQNYEAAISLFTKAIQLNAYYTLAYNYRAESYKALDMNSLALADYSQSLVLEPEEAQLYFGRANAYLALNNFSAALTDFRQAFKLEPRNQEILKLIIETNFLAENYFETAQLIDQLRKSNPTLVEDHYHYISALCKASVKDYRGAIEALSRFIEVKNDEPAYYEERASYYLKVNAFQPAIDDYQQAIAMAPDVAENYLACVNIYILQEDYTNAIRYLDLALLQHQDYPEFWYLRGLSYLRSG
ncbi:MAG: tetratricopeptide repeat protein [Bacteroidota bacterium]